MPGVLKKSVRFPNGYRVRRSAFGLLHRHTQKHPGRQRPFCLPLRWLTLGFLALLNCFNPFAPGLEQNASPDIKITEQASPEEVLQNFIYAYTFKDSLVYENLLDSAFVFVYFDPNLGTSGLFASWNRDIDLKTTGRLFRNFETLNLVWDSTIYEDLQATSAELAKTLHLHLFGPQGEFNLTGNAVFNFRKSPWDDKWRITRWKDESQM